MLPLISPFGLSPPLLSKPVQTGPMFFSIPGVSGVAVPNGTTALTAAAAVKFKWPQTFVVREWILIPSSGLQSDAGCLAIRITDQSGNIIFDGNGLSASSNFLPVQAEQGIAPSGFHLTGWVWSPQWAKFARLVRPGEQWSFQLTNSKVGGGSITPRLLFAVEKPLVEPPPQRVGRLQ